MPSPLFLNWDTPWLPQLAEKLLESFSADSKKGDLSDLVVILPAKRAGRRLLEFLAVQAAQQEIVLIPPRIVTLREAIPFLLPLEKKSQTEATAFVQRVAWRDALHALTPQQRATLGIMHADSFTLLPFLDGLKDRLGAYGIDFATVAARIGTLHPESADREEPRWEALAALHKNYRSRLQTWGFIDPDDLLHTHLSEGIFKKCHRVLIAGVIDAPDFFAPFFKKVNPTIFVIGPQHHAPGFDEQGRVLPPYWLARPPASSKTEVIACDRNEDQAREVISLLRSCKQAPSNCVTIVAERESLPLLRDALEEASFKMHWGGGISFSQGRLYQLLNVTAEVMKQMPTPDPKALGALLRHPDIQRHLPQALSFLKKLDRYEREHLPAELDTKSFPPLLEIERLLDLPSKPMPLTHCVVLLRNFLRRLLGDEVVSGSTSEGHHLLGALKIFLEQLDALETWDSLSQLWTLSELISLLLEVMASAAIPEPEDPEAIEGVGWLELASDDAPCAIVTSCQEGFLPRTLPKHPLLPEALCKAFCMDDNATLLARDFYLLHLITASRDLKIIAPRYNARGEVTRPSRLLTLGCSEEELPKRILELLQPARSHKKEMPSLTATQQSQIQALPIGKEAIDHLTVTSLKTYLQSPRLFYLKHVLKLQEILPTPLEMTPSHFGILLHALLGMFGADPLISVEADAETISAWLEKKFFPIAADYFPAPSPVITLQLHEVVKSLRGFAIAQAAHRLAGWTIIATESFLEKNWHLPDGRTICLQGRIDRIDWHPEKQRWLLIDYKTSNALQWEQATPDAEHYQKKGDSTIWHDLQLPLYLKLAPSLAVIQESGLLLPTLENTDLCYCQLPLESEKTRFSSYFQNAMILPAWEEAERVLTCILDSKFEEIGSLDASRMPTLAALCGIAGLWN